MRRRTPALTATRVFATLAVAALVSIPARPSAVSQRPVAEARPDFDIRDGRSPVLPRADVAAAHSSRERRVRFNSSTGSIRVLSDPGLPAHGGGSAAAIRAHLIANAQALGLDGQDLAALVLAREYTSRSNGVRHVVFRQVVDGYPVFDSMVGVHLRPDGEVVRITSNAAPVAGRDPRPAVGAAAARLEATVHAGEGETTTASLVWLPVDGRLRLAWHVSVTAETSDLYDVLIDAHSAELLVRRNRVRDADGSGRILQSSNAQDPRRPDPMPLGGDGTACPPPGNHVVRSLNAQFRDSSSVLAATGRLEGNNARVFRGTASVPSATGTPDGSGWLFDFPFNSQGSAETFLFFALNYAHDFFYDLGFDEAAGNFQLDNFGRGGTGGDPVKANARASGRNNANYVHATDGSSPTINMFLWDGTGCWAEDVNGDAVPDLDGDYDFDIIIHEFHHGVSLRLNTAFTGNEAGAIGEGGGDFFAYSVNGDTVLAEYARPGGLRRINDRDYGDWTCLFGLFCEVHDNGEIWANALWEVRERFRTDLVRGSAAAAVNESHQLYIDALSLSPPSPTMLDLRDAMLQADALRNGGSPASQNFCRLWESFARRGMGRSATDTADNGLNQVVAAYDVPAGCVPPPAPPTPPVVTVSATAASAAEAGPVSGTFTFSRTTAGDAPLTVSFLVGGSAAPNVDYAALPGSAVIPAGALSVALTVTPIDDAIVESNETVLVSLSASTAYSVGSPSSATVSIVSDDLAPDLVVTAVSAPRTAAAGMTFDVTDTTKNQGAGGAGASQTTFYLSANPLLEAADSQAGARAIPELGPGALSTATTPVTVPETITPGTYFLFAKADGAGSVTESSEANNTRTTTIAIGPDLVISTMTAPTAAAAGGTMTIGDTTANTGVGPIAESATTFYLSANSLIDTSDIQLGQRSVPGLLQGATSSGSTTVNIPQGIATGTYYVIGKADAGGLVAEASETNNLRTAVVRIGPDLTVSALTAPLRAASGGSISVTDTTKNSGAGSSPASTTAFFLSANSVLDAADTRIPATRVVPALAASASSTGTTTLVLPPVAPGTWYLLANADDPRAIVETLETNNVRAALVRIGPDLAFTSASSPTTAAAGTTLSVTATLRNSGGEAAGASIVRFYLSSNTAFDATDTELDAVMNVGTLGVDAVHTGTVAVPLPSNRSGSLYLLMVADAAQTVAEANETNNVFARFVQISPGS